MDLFWMLLLVAVIASAAGAGSVLVMFRVRAHRPAGTGTPCREAQQASAGPDRWLCRMRRCEQAVRRAELAAESVSSEQARSRLRLVVRRMRAELPSVRTLVELGRGLDGGPRRDASTERVFEQLTAATDRFAAITDQVLESVVRLVAAPDLDRLGGEVGALREQFPLVRPLSEVWDTGQEQRHGREALLRPAP